MRRQRKERLLEQLQQQRAKKLEEANQRIGDAQQQLGGLDAARSQQTKQLEEHENEIRELNDTLYRARMEHDAGTVRVQQQQQQRRRAGARLPPGPTRHDAPSQRRAGPGQPPDRRGLRRHARWCGEVEARAACPGHGDGPRCVLSCPLLTPVSLSGK